MGNFINSHPNLFTVKSIVTILMMVAYIGLTIYSTVTGKVVSSEFVEIVRMIMVFYFGTQVGEYKASVNKPTNTK